MSSFRAFIMTWIIQNICYKKSSTWLHQEKYQKKCRSHYDRFRVNLDSESCLAAQNVKCGKLCQFGKQDAAGQARMVSQAIREMGNTPVGQLGAALEKQGARLTGLAGKLEKAEAKLAGLRAQADSAGAAEIYTLYRAGILDGKGEDGSYEPQSGIRRCEAAAILARMLDESLRVSA